MLVITHRPCSPQLAGSLFGHWVFYCQAWGSHHALAWWSFHTEAAVWRWWQLGTHPDPPAADVALLNDEAVEQQRKALRQCTLVEFAGFSCTEQRSCPQSQPP